MMFNMGEVMVMPAISQRLSPFLKNRSAMPPPPETISNGLILIKGGEI